MWNPFRIFSAGYKEAKARSQSLFEGFGKGFAKRHPEQQKQVLENVYEVLGAREQVLRARKHGGDHVQQIYRIAGEYKLGQDIKKMGEEAAVAGKLLVGGKHGNDAVRLEAMAEIYAQSYKKGEAPRSFVAKLLKSKRVERDIAER